ncbi:MAG: hypothetical protein JXA93_25490, partial [Anaerolineae bacterium]|nr:hypothetical protein [Anaerolineae bacterium]
MTDRLYVDKTSDTLADPLVAFGLAAVMRDTLKRTGRRSEPTVALRDCGAYFQIDLNPALDDTRIAIMQGPYTPAEIIYTAKRARDIPDGMPPQAIIDYDAERDKRNEFFAVLKSLPTEARQALARGQEHPALDALAGLHPHEHWDVLRAINPPSIIGYNKLMAQWWSLQDALPEVLR